MGKRDSWERAGWLFFCKDEKLINYGTYSEGIEKLRRIKERE